MTGGRGHVALVVLVVAAGSIAPFLMGIWRRASGADPVRLGLAWACTLTWTMVLNLYATTYDTTLVLLGVLLMADALWRTDQRLPLVPTSLLALLYVVPWIPPVPVGARSAVQQYTLALIALGLYQLRLARRTAQREAAASPLSG